jgi:hypothetical protein
MKMAADEAKGVGVAAEAEEAVVRSKMKQKMAQKIRKINIANLDRNARGRTAGLSIELMMASHPLLVLAKYLSKSSNIRTTLGEIIKLSQSGSSHAIGT